MKFATRKLARLAIGAALGTAAVSAFAIEGYTTDSQGKIVRNAFGECWQTSSWTKDKAVEGCQGYVAPAPAPVVEAPKPAPAPAPVVEAPKPVAPAPAKMETITLNASGLFDLDKATLKDEGKQSLESVAAVLNERKYDAAKTKITVVGHTDRLGKADHNQKLSEARAAAARDFLVSKGVAGNMISSAGKGFSEPVTKPEDCKKVMKNKSKLIQCYAPDRRVVIEISAVREAQ
ncbi:OmpA family protein [Burkholderiaceae bacterium DAT-1]|nr:OmpA family protein [Burkholderiaceae bacterium DAT-1]